MSPKKKDPQTPRSAERPKHRSITRWSDEKLLAVFCELRRTCSTRKIDIRAALDDAVKVVGPHCTGDALVQQLVKREKRILENGGPAGTPKSTPKKKKGQDDTTTGAGEEEDGSPKSQAATESPASAPRKKPTRTKKVATSNDTTNLDAGPSTPRVKSEKATDEKLSPQTPSPAQDESDSEYTESPDKSKKKRARGSIKKATALKSSTKKARKQLSDSDSDSEDDFVQTPTKKATSKPVRRSLVKKTSTITASNNVQPGATARKMLPKVEALKQSDQTEDEEATEDETHVDVQELNFAQFGFEGPSGISLSEPHEHAQSLRQSASDHESFDSTPLSSNRFGGNSFNDFSFQDNYTQQSFDDNDFGPTLFVGDLSSLYKSQFNPLNISASLGANNDILTSTIANVSMGNYAALKSMQRKAVASDQTVGAASNSMFVGSGFAQHLGALHNSDIKHANSYQNRNLSFDSNSSGTTFNSMDSFSGSEQDSLFPSANGSFEDQFDFSTGPSQALVFECENDTPKRGALASDMGLLGFEA